MSDSTTNFYDLNGHRWAATTQEHRIQYLAGFVEGIYCAAEQLRAGKAVGLDAYIRGVPIRELADALTEIYRRDRRNWDIPIANALHVAASIARLESEDDVNEQIERLRRNGN
jgi:hypothetical protein